MLEVCSTNDNNGTILFLVEEIDYLHYQTVSRVL